MRLTLRTLLAYLDDTLDAAEVKQIGQKVAESDTAQELIARIKQVTRRRRLTTPPPTGPGSRLDANTIAEYLENKLSEDQVAEVEQVSLGSDVHLAELAACHQLLTLILGEPILIPPTSRQRMYGLVKGREAIPFRKPRTEPVVEEEERTTEESYQADETLRMGLPAWRKRSSWASRLALIAGTLAACLLLAVAIYQAVKPGNGENNDQSANNQPNGNTPDKNKSNPPEVAPGQGGKKGPPPDDDGGNKTGNDVPKSSGPKGKNDEPGPKGPKVTPEDPKKPPVNPPEGAWTPVTMAPPAKGEVVVGKFEKNSKMPEALLHNLKDGKWRLLDLVNYPNVYTNMPLVSLPGFTGTVQLKSGLQMRLLGALPEETPEAQLVREAMVELHPHDELDLDFTLLRGKLIVTNNKDKPAQVRLRFANPTQPDKAEVWDLLLKDKGSEIFVERWTMIVPGEPFYPNAKDNSRKGPLAAVHVVVREGNVDLRRGDTLYQLHKPAKVEKDKEPPDARVYWVSTTGVGKEGLIKVPEYTNERNEPPEPTFPADVKKEVKDKVMEFYNRFLQTRQKMEAARKKLVLDLLGNPENLDVVLKAMVKSEKPENFADRILAVRCFGAVNRVDALVDALGNKSFIDVRRTAIDTLRRWLSYERDNDYVLFKALTADSLYSDASARSLITMLHGFSAQDALSSPVLYQALIPKLNDEKLAIRELAGLQLYLELPKHFPATSELPEALKTIDYAPDANENVRQKAVEDWTKLLKSGKLPPPPPPVK